jgi:hypothetical protein
VLHRKGASCYLEPPNLASLPPDPALRVFMLWSKTCEGSIP